MRKESCKTCYYNHKGYCHRYPPVIVGQKVYAENFSCVSQVDFPPITELHLDDWCGEYKEKI